MKCKPYKINYWVVSVFALLTVLSASLTPVEASSHREAPLIANDPLADNTDLYAFRSPDDPNTVTIIANYIRDEITYRFTFDVINEDPTTFFNIRLGAQNQKATYTMEKSTDGGNTFQTVLSNGVVPPNNIGPRSIESGVGLSSTYPAEFAAGILTASTGETVF